MPTPPARRTGLVRPLPDGPLDVVGDVHGEVEALAALLARLGYAPDGAHPEGRRLVFVGDLVDRGPDSPRAVRRVRALVEAGRADCVLGNHEFNLLIGSHKPDNFWFFGNEPRGLHPAHAAAQVRAGDEDRAVMLSFFRTLPLALERADLRVVHACWDDGLLEAARGADDAVTLFHSFRPRIDQALQLLGITDRAEVKLAHQNRNPVKRVVSGPEQKAAAPILTMGRLRHEQRVVWWHDYRGPLCVFGHYWRTLLPGETDNERLFVGVPRNATLGSGNTLCIDYSVGKRFQERLDRPGTDTFVCQLAALRLPERLLVFDDGERLPLLDPSSP
jgi:hypothetical protein